MGKNGNKKSQEIFLPELLKKIKEGTIKGRDLSPGPRQACVEAFLFEGLSNLQIQSIMGCSNRMLRRDMAAIFERNALLPCEETTRKLLGEYSWKSRMHHANIMRFARSKDVTPYQRAQMEAAAYQVLDRTIERLQSLGIMSNLTKKNSQGMQCQASKKDKKKSQNYRDEYEEIVAREIAKMHPGDQENLLKPFDYLVSKVQADKEKERRGKEGEFPVG